MAAVRELVTILGFDLKAGPLKKYEQGIDRAKAHAMGLVKVFTGLAAAGGGLFLLTKRVADLGDTIGETSQKIGIGAEALQKLQFIGKQSGIEQGTLNSGLKIFSKNIQQAATKGKGAAKVFQQLGIRVKDAKGQVIPTEQLFSQVADRFAQMEDGSAKTALAMQLFGRAGAELIPTLNKGGKEIDRIGKELKDMGLILSDDVIKQSDKFNDDLQLAQGIVGGFANLLGAELMPAFHDVIKGFIDWAKESSKTQKVQDSIKKVAAQLRPIINKVADGFKKFADNLPELIDSLGGAEGIMQKLITAFEIFIGFKIAMIVGNLVFAFVHLAAAIKLAGFSMVDFNAALLAAPIAGAAAGVVLGNLILLAKDYAEALTGSAEAQQRLDEMGRVRKEALTSVGDFFGIENLGGQWESILDSFWKGVFFVVHDIIIRGNKMVFDAIKTVITSPIQTMRQQFAVAWSLIRQAGVAAFDAIIAKIKGIASAVKQAVAEAIPSLDSLAASFLGFGGFKGFLPSAAPGATGTTAPGPTSSLNRGAGSIVGGGGGQNTVNNNQDYQVASTVNVNVQSQADPKAIADAASAQVKTALGSMLRQTQRALQPSEAVG